MSKIFLHVDLNNFYANAECKSRPGLDGKPVAVAGDPKKRHGIVLSKNEIAKALGVKTGDTVAEAAQKAPGLVFIPPDFSKYDALSKRFFSICNGLSCYVEPFGADECWIDCTGSARLFGTGKQMADLLRERVKLDMGITASVGVSFTKIFAKLGSDMKKPDATTVINKEDLHSKVWPLPADRICGVGRRLGVRLKKININTIGELAAADERVLKLLFGSPGADLLRIARGEEEGSVREAVSQREQKSIGHGLTTIRDLVTRADIENLVYYLSELVAARLARHEMRGKGVSVHLRSSGLEYFGKQAVLRFPVCAAGDIAAEALKLVAAVHDGCPLRSISISAFDLYAHDEKFVQLTMFDDKRNAEKQESLDRAVQTIRKKYGKPVIMRACHINSDLYTEKDVGDFLPFKR